MRFLLLLLVALCSIPSAGGWFLTSETGLVWDSGNDVRVPNEGGTDISLVDDLEADPALFGRLVFGRTLGRHTVSVLVAPLRLESAGTLEKDVIFQGTEFTEGTAIEADYRFDSYRLTWRYGLVRRPSFSLDLGLTAKIRDASIRLSSADASAVSENTGLVPLFSFALDWAVTPKLHLLMDGDAAAASQGRAEDVRTAVGWAFSPGAVLTAGWRFLEGGADVDQVYNFTFLNYASLGFRLAL